MRTSNPALRDSVFASARQGMMVGQPAMTISGTVNKTGILLLITTAMAALSWNLCYTAPDAEMSSSLLYPIMMGGTFGGLIFSLITIFKKTAAPYTAPIYAALEGLALGAISVVFEQRYPGLAFQAVLGTFGTLFALLGAYKTGLIQATEKFKLGVMAATGGVAMIYVLTMIMGFFGVHVPYVHEGGPIGVGFSIVVVIIAALNLVLDFDFIESGARAKAPKYMEWYGAFSLLVTLVWLYLEILRMLGKSRD
jgi:uncharacterized YccA/Bax inhibitor family protein